MEPVHQIGESTVGRWSRAPAGIGEAIILSAATFLAAVVAIAIQLLHLETFAPLALCYVVWLVLTALLMIRTGIRSIFALIPSAVMMIASGSVIVLNALFYGL